ncbi:MAG: Bifunctional aspartate aminotransferase and L-aspartate beta-decarboxylase [Candidatus Anoxychlamydiales bacterium]|nr:Bifunctional aspartate aminotransferase and L-aspartate beta-decarboxylase [Candidatus Anoxychlamydiales bacterium]
MEKEKLKKYHEMSPFEVKDILITLAKESFKKNGKAKDKYLNAGRGNPNFFNTTVRDAFAHFTLFANHFADVLSPFEDIAFRYTKENLYKNFSEFIKRSKKNKATVFLEKAIDFAIKKFKFDPDSFLYELADAAIGDFYPMPPRIFPSVEKISTSYLQKILTPDNKLPAGKFDLFATEGATAAMIYIFNSLKNNKIVNPKDHIAIASPIFSPYLEIPMLSEFKLVEVLIKADEFDSWQIPDSELKKLLDPSIKALFLVNPTNPTAVAIKDETLFKIAHIIKKHRKDLIIIADTVYATFVKEFHSFVKEVPENTICVYSYSKYFGVTGWRLGVIMLHENNVLDKIIKNLSEKDKKEIDKRYITITPEPRKIKFIDRLSMDSRDSALAHTGGLSCPQQVIMALFSLYEIMDTEKIYKKDIRDILRKRITNLYENLEIKIPIEKGNTYYYTLIDLAEVAQTKYGEDFKKYLIKNVDILDFLFKLAKEKFIVCLSGDGFAGPKWSLRVSLANLKVEDYITIGKALSDLLGEYHKEFKKNKKT